MEAILNNTVSVSVLLGVIWGIFSFSVLKPLNKAIENLDAAISDLRAELLTAEDRRHELEKKVVEIDHRSISTQSRLEKLEDKIDELEHR